MPKRPIVKRFDAAGLKRPTPRPAADHYRLTPKRAVQYIANARRTGTDPVTDMRRDGYSAFLAEKYVALFDADYNRRRSEKARPPVPVGEVVRRVPARADARP